MAIFPPLVVGLHRTGYCPNALDPARRSMPYLPLTDFPPLSMTIPPPQDDRAARKRVRGRPSLPSFPPINQMPRVEEWERDLLGNLAGSVEILPDEHWQ